MSPLTGTKILKGMSRIPSKLLLCLLSLSFCFALDEYPKQGWVDDYNPIANPEAEPGGEIKLFGSQFPKSFNYYLDTNTLSRSIFLQMFETLLTSHPVTLEDEPGIARRWTLSDDKRIFTFYLDPEAKWSDGKPITAYDVEWTFNALLDPKNMTGPHKISLERFHPPKVIDDLTIQFEAREVHWRNLSAISGFLILPKHDWQDKDFNKINFEFPVISGPYQIAEIKENISVTLQRRSDWWFGATKRAQGTNNFATIQYRFYSERDTAYEAFKKGEIDLFAVYTSHRWIKNTSDDIFKQNWVVKQVIYNKKPMGFQGFAINMRRPKFQDIRVRKALAHLLDREKMNRTLMYNQYALQSSVFEDLYDSEHPNRNPRFNFDKTKARQLLKEAGWVVNPETLLLEKDGQPFKIKFLTNSPTSDKFLVIYKEDLADVGIELTIDKKDWVGWANDMDEFNYDMTWAAWAGGSPDRDPESLWHSREADRPSGNNLTGLKDERVDALIERQKSIFDRAQRNAILREIDQIVCSAVPYILLWYNDHDRLLYWNKFGTPDTVLDKYGGEFAALSYWWSDPDSEADLEFARKQDEALAPKDYKIVFDERFQP